ncbi:MAG: hypothetical protein ACKO96_45155 [Flammeovirgaceae bacterium]
MSDGHTDSRRYEAEVLIRDAAGRDCFENDLIWYASDNGSLWPGNIIDIDYISGTLFLMTRSNSMIEISFKPKNNIPISNMIIRG